jgi:hypothetical protein
MGLAFKEKTKPIPRQSTGPQTLGDQVAFTTEVVQANVVVKSFKLEHVGAAQPTDIVKVGITGVSHAGNDVSYNIICEYSGKNAGGTFTGEVTALVIAEVK